MSNTVPDRTIASCLEHGSTNIPLPKDRYRARYEQAEQERKALLTKNEKSKYTPVFVYFLSADCAPHIFDN